MNLTPHRKHNETFRAYQKRREAERRKVKWHLKGRLIFHARWRR